MERANDLSISSRRQPAIEMLLPENINLALSNLRFSAVFISFERLGIGVNCPKKKHRDILETRGDDPMSKRFQVSAQTAETKEAKVRKCDYGHLGELISCIMTAYEVNPKRLQLWHE